MKNQTLGQRVICASEPAYNYIVDCQISMHEIYLQVQKSSHKVTWFAFFYSVEYFCPDTVNLQVFNLPPLIVSFLVTISSAVQLSPF